MAQHEWRWNDMGSAWECANCGIVALENQIAFTDRQPCAGKGAAPVTDIAAARVAKAQYANAISPSDLLRAVIAELEGGMACSHIVVVLALEEQEVASVALRLGGAAGYHTRLGVLESAKDVLKRESMK